MPKVDTIQTNFSNGEISPLLDGRVDVGKYYNSAKEIKNFIVTPAGGIERTPGTKFVSEVKTSSKKTRLFSFEFSTEQAYILEIGDQYIRFYRDNGRIEDPPGTPVEIATPYLEADLFDLQFAQDADTLYIVHNNYAIRKLTRTSHIAWSLIEVEFKNGPYLPVNSTALVSDTGIKISLNSIIFGSIQVQLVADAPLFDADVVGSVWLVKNRWLKVTAFNSTIEVDATMQEDGRLSGTEGPKALSAATQADPVVITTTTSHHEYESGDEIEISGVVGMTQLNGKRYIVVRLTSNTYSIKDLDGFDVDGTGFGAYISGGVSDGKTEDWAEGAWGGRQGYPACVTFHEQRLAFANSPEKPQTIWMSRSGEFERMDPGANASDAINVTIASEQVNVIQWLLSGDLLAFGTSGGIFVSRTPNSEALTPSNMNVQRDTTFGSAFKLPKRIGNFTYFLQRNNKTLRELSLEFDRYGDTRLAVDMTLMAEHIAGDEGIVEIDYQQSPHNILWCVREDGQIATLTRQVRQEVTGWSRQVTSSIHDSISPGLYDSVFDGLFKSIAIIPKTTYDEVWVIVERLIGGTTKKYVEYFTAPTFTDPEDAFFVHSGLSLDLPLVISGATQADPVVITSTGHGLSNGNSVVIRNIIGMSELNKKKFKIKNKTANTFELTDKNDVDIDGTEFSAYVGSGEARKANSVISGLSHLEGRTVSILVDGSVHPDKVVSSGSVTLNNTYGEIHIGLAYNTKMLGLRPEVGLDTGTSQGKIKRIYEAFVRIHESLGMQVGTEKKQDKVPFRSTSDAMDQAVPFFTGDKRVPFPAGYDRDSRILVTQDQPLPLNILAIILNMNMESG